MYPSHRLAVAWRAGEGTNHGTWFGDAPSRSRVLVAGPERL